MIDVNECACESERKHTKAVVVVISIWGLRISDWGLRLSVDMSVLVSNNLKKTTPALESGVLWLPVAANLLTDLQDPTHLLGG